MVGVGSPVSRSARFLTRIQRFSGQILENFDKFEKRVQYAPPSEGDRSDHNVKQIRVFTLELSKINLFR